jgi:hypothetical protein
MFALQEKAAVAAQAAPSYDLNIGNSDIHHA